MVSRTKGYNPIVWSVIFFSLSLLINSCNNGDNGPVPAVPKPSVRSAERAVKRLLDLYRTALRQEDIDRLQPLLSTAASPDLGSFSRQRAHQWLANQAQRMDAESFRDMISEDFRSLNILDVYISIPHEGIDATPDVATATFQEIRSVEDPGLLEQRTRVINTTFQLIGSKTDGVITFRITEVFHDDPHFEIVTPGQIFAGIPSRITISKEAGTFSLSEVEIEVLDSDTSPATQILLSNDDMFYGFFTPPMRSDPKPLQIRLRGANEEIMVSHQYRLRMPSEGIIQKISGMERADLFAIAVAPSGTIVAGGKLPSFPFGGLIFQISPEGSLISFRPFLNDPEGTLRDLVFDSLQRLHVIIFLSPVSQAVGVVVQDRDINCQTVNVQDPTYPFLTPDGRPSPSTRALTASDGDIWLFGSDGGVGRVSDSFQDGPCQDVIVEYRPVFRRATHPTLATNTVPALVQDSNGTLWFGTALGLSRLEENDTFATFLFNREEELSENPRTLERFFRLIAEAIFDAQPILSVAIGDESFVESFGRSLIKQDLIFSAIEEAPGRLWIGTLGGGLRRVDITEDSPEDTLLLTRENGLSSNIIFALAVEREGVVWVATDEGVSRLHTEEESIRITNFSALDGLKTPVRDLAVDDTGTLWLATGAGFFRLTQQGGLVQGDVRMSSGSPIVGADVIALGTPFRTVTDGSGHFVLANLPPGTYRLQIDGQLAIGGPFDSMEREVEVNGDEQTIDEVILAFVDNG